MSHPVERDSAAVVAVEEAEENIADDTPMEQQPRKTIRNTARRMVKPEETLRQTLAPAGLSPYEVIVTDDEVFVATHNTFGQRVYVKIPSENQHLFETASKMSHSATANLAQKTTFSSRPLQATQKLLDQKTIVCGHMAEMGEEGFCYATEPKSQKIFETVEDAESTYGNTKGDALPSPVVLLDDVIQFPDEVFIKTAAENNRIKKISERSAGQMARLIELSERLTIATKKAHHVIEEKFGEIGGLLSKSAEKDMKFNKIPATPETIEARGTNWEHMVYWNYLLGSVIGDAYRLGGAEEKIESALSSIVAILTDINNKTQQLEGITLPYTPFK